MSKRWMTLAAAAMLAGLSAGPASAKGGFDGFDLDMLEPHFTYSDGSSTLQTAKYKTLRKIRTEWFKDFLMGPVLRTPCALGASEGDPNKQAVAGALIDSWKRSTKSAAREMAQALEADLRPVNVPAGNLDEVVSQAAEAVKINADIHRRIAILGDFYKALERPQACAARP